MSETAGDSPGIWHTWPDPAKLTSWRGETMAAHLDIRFVQAGDDYLTAAMPVDHRSLQPFGLLHGGASCALAETLASIAGNLVLDTSRNHALGMSINASHLRPVSEGRIFATARPRHLGRKTQVWAVEIEDEKQRPVCVARITLAVIEGQWSGSRD
ncbi:MAG: hotdog fold thioesterase [Xanthomonadales bacterium]|nr:hotdog fold thioesterase [Xanthomonadales bacterium]